MKRLHALFALVLLSSCGYALVGKSNTLPPTIKSIQVPTFVNRTTRVELEQRVTQAIADELVSRGRMHLVSSPADADAILKGSIESFRVDPIAVNSEGRATRYQVIVTAKIALVDHRNEDKELWKNDQYLFTENYEINPEAIADPFDKESRAIRDIAQRFAESVVASLLEGF